MSVRGRVVPLDGLRGIAILLVMLHHQTVQVGSTAVDRFAAFWTTGGWIGVDLFFVLSGFLITGILYDAKRTSHYFRNFYARRVLRIFPLYYGVVGFSLLVLPHIPNWKSDTLGRITGDEIFYWTYLSNVSMAVHNAFRHGILDISWSLAIEEQFYIVWPIVVLFLERRALTRLCVCLFAGAMLWRTAALLAGMPSIAVYVLTPSRLDPLAIGALIALAARGNTGLASLEGWARYVLLGSLASFVAIGVVSGGFDPYSAVMQVAGYSILALLFGSVLVLTLAAGPDTRWRRFLSNPFLVAFGTYSYALYLFHLPLRAILRDWVFPEQFLTLMGSTLPGQLLFYVAATSLAFVAAWLSWHIYERHFLALKDYFAPSPTRVENAHVGWLSIPRAAGVLTARKRTQT